MVKVSFSLKLMPTRWRSNFGSLSQSDRMGSDLKTGHNCNFRKQHQTNPDIKSDIKPRDARWIDPTPKTHPELVKIKSRPQTAPSRSSSRTSYSRHDDQQVMIH